MALIGTNMNVAVEKTRDTAITITGITNANPAVVTATNTLSAGDIVILSLSDGMVEFSNFFLEF